MAVLEAIKTYPNRIWSGSEFVPNVNKEQSSDNFTTVAVKKTNEVLGFPDGISVSEMEHHINGDLNGTISTYKPSFYDRVIRDPMSKLGMDMFQPKFITDIKPSAERAFVTSFARGATADIVKPNFSEQEAQAFPAQAFAGQLAGAVVGLKGISSLLGMIKLPAFSAYASKVISKLPEVAQKAAVAGGQSAAVGGTYKAISETSNEIRDEEHPELAKIGKAVLHDTLWWGGIGALVGPASKPIGVAASTGLGYVMAKADGAREQDALLNGAVLGGFHLLSSHGDQPDVREFTIKKIEQNIGDYIQAKNPLIDENVANQAAREMVQNHAEDVLQSNIAKDAQGNPIEINNIVEPLIKEVKKYKTAKNFAKNIQKDLLGRGINQQVFDMINEAAGNPKGAKEILKDVKNPTEEQIINANEDFHKNQEKGLIDFYNKIKGKVPSESQVVPVLNHKQEVLKSKDLTLKLAENIANDFLDVKKQQNEFDAEHQRNKDFYEANKNNPATVEDTKKLIIDTLTNDTTSTNEELSNYFMQEAGFDKKTADFLVSKRGNVTDFVQQQILDRITKKITSESGQATIQPEQPKIMTEEQYLSSKGYGFLGYAEPALNRQPRATEKEIKKNANKILEKGQVYDQKRAEVRKEYADKVASGEIRPPTREEILISQANGNPESEATQAARRLLNKRGIDWKSESGQLNISPVIESIADTTKEAINILSPRSFVPKPALDEVMTKKGGLDKVQFELGEKLHKITNEMDKWPQEKQIKFIDNIKQGKEQETPEEQAIADMMRRVEDNYWNEAKQFKDSLAYLENHYRVLWKVIPGKPEAKGFQGLFRRPLQGTKGFMKHSTLETMAEGIAMGGEPYTYNPMKMWQDSLVDMQKFITSQRMWKSMKDMGYAKFVKQGGTIPEGFVRLNDNLAKTYFPAEIKYSEDGETYTVVHQTGEYYVEENVGRILNNFLSRDLIRESNIGNALMKIKNITTSLELSLSPFHAAYVSLATASSSIGLGAQKIINRAILQQEPKAFVDGLKDILFSGVSPAKYAKTGGQAIKMVSQEDFINTPEGKDFIKEFPDAKQLIDDLFIGGGKLAMHQDYKINSLRTFQEALKNKEPWAVAWNAIPAGNEFIMRPLFETFIPRLKIGTFLKEYSLELAQREGELASGTLTRPELARRVWDSVENRLGEMNFDNLFWNRTFKSGLQLAFRSVTWKLGALRNIGASLPEQINEFVKASKEERTPLLTGNMAWLIGVGALASAFSYITMGLTGQGQPKDVKDLIAPRYDDQGNRISLNTHIKDWVHIAHNPAGFLSNSLSGEIGRTIDVWGNKDFYGVEIYHPDDPGYKQAVDIATHLFPTPFSIANQKKLKGESAPLALKATTLAGFTQPSPGYISNTPAEEEAYKILKENQPIGSRTKAEFEKSQLKSQLRQEVKNTGKTSNIDKAIKEGKLTGKDKQKIIKDSKKDTLERVTNGFTVNEVIKVMEKANAEEKKQLMPILKKKIHNKMESASKEDLIQLKKIKERFF